jgi:phosphosulfolactate synthase
MARLRDRCSFLSCKAPGEDEEDGMQPTCRSGSVSGPSKGDRDVSTGHARSPFPHPASSRLNLPTRTSKPRTAGITAAIDGGVPIQYFLDVIRSHSEILDFVKFGWGTAIVSKCLNEKIAELRRSGFGFFFGGTLFEKFYSCDAFENYLEFCRDHSAPAVEISSGSIAIPSEEIARIIGCCCDAGYIVFCELGHKDAKSSEAMTPAEWARQVRETDRAGADFIVLEARESGTSGICKQNGKLRLDVIEAILGTGVPSDKLIFEAPRREQQAYLISLIGANVNLANIGLTDLISLETLRCGLRFETLTMK